MVLFANFYISLDLMQTCCKILKDILEKESKGWHIKFKETLITQLRGKEIIDV